MEDSLGQILLNLSENSYNNTQKMSTAAKQFQQTHKRPQLKHFTGISVVCIHLEQVVFLLHVVPNGQTCPSTAMDEDD